jgi:Predicted nucleotide-binding protein containing TIR-like domain
MFHEPLGQDTSETLVNSLPRFDFAVLVLTPDDFVNSRDVESLGPRDNVLFELGLFMGRLGRSRTFILHQSNSHLKIPSDLSGMTTATYEWPRDDNSFKSAVGPACDSIRDVVHDLGLSDTKAARDISDIRSRQDELQLRQAEQRRISSVILRNLIKHPVNARKAPSTRTTQVGKRLETPASVRFQRAIFTSGGLS